MKYTPRDKNGRDEESKLYSTLEPVAKGLEMAVLELSLSRRKGRGGSAGTVQIRVTVMKAGNMGVDDCSRFHRAIMPRLELLFPGSDLDVEVSSPGISRLIKDGCEMINFIGHDIRCYRAQGSADGKTAEVTDTAADADGSGWIEGRLCAADGKEITLETVKGKIVLPYETIAKAKLSGI